MQKPERKEIEKLKSKLATLFLRILLFGIITEVKGDVRQTQTADWQINEVNIVECSNRFPIPKLDF